MVKVVQNPQHYHSEFELPPAQESVFKHRLDIRNGPYTYNLCSGTNQVFRVSGGLSYEFRVSSTTLYTVGASSTSAIVTFDPLINGGHTLVTSNTVDVIVYDRALTASGTINPNACSTQSSAVIVIVTSQPIVDVFATSIISNTFCAGDSVDFRITPTGAATYEYNVSNIPGWNNLGATSTFTVNMLNPTVNGSDNVTVTVRVTTAGGCTSTNTIFLFENEIIDPGTISSTTTTVCSGQEPADIIGSTPSATISGTSFTFEWYRRASAVTTTWTEIVGETGSDLSLVGNPLFENTDFLRVTTAAINGSSCTESSTALFRIDIAPAPTVNFIAPDSTPVTAPYTYTICSGSNQEFRASGGLSYEFRVNNFPRYTVSATSIADVVTFDPLINISPAYTLGTSDTVDVIVYEQTLTASGTVDPNSCSSQSASVTIIVSALTPAQVFATSIVSKTFCSGDSVDFRITPTGAATYEYNVSNIPGWTNLGATNTFTVNMPNPTVNGSDNVTITVRVTTAGVVPLQIPFSCMRMKS